MIGLTDKERYLARYMVRSTLQELNMLPRVISGKQIRELWGEYRLGKWIKEGKLHPIQSKGKNSTMYFDIDEYELCIHNQ